MSYGWHCCTLLCKIQSATRWRAEKLKRKHSITISFPFSLQNTNRPRPHNSTHLSQISAQEEGQCQQADVVHSLMAPEICWPKPPLQAHPCAYSRYNIIGWWQKQSLLSSFNRVTSRIRLFLDLSLKTDRRTLGPNLHQQVPFSQEFPGSTLFVSAEIWTS